MTRTRRAAPSAVAASLAAVDRALTEVAAGRPVVLLDDADAGEVRGDLVLAAEKATPELLAFLVRHTSGFVCVALPDADADRLDLPPMTAPGRGLRDTAFTVTVDAAEGISTGISAVDRARTIRLLAGPGTLPADLRRPGHVVPVRARDGGVLRRPGTAEAVVDLARLAGLRPVGIAAGLVDDSDGTLTGRTGVEEFCAAHGLAAVRTADLVTHRRVRERQVAALGEARIPTRHGVFRAVGFEDLHTGAEHVALVLGDLSAREDVLVHVHTECLAGDVFGSLGCRCGGRLDDALAAVAAEGRGVVLYLRPDGRARGAVLPVQHPRRRTGLAAQVLTDLGVRAGRLVQEDPADARELADSGIRVVRRVRPVAVLPPVAGVPLGAVGAAG